MARLSDAQNERNVVILTGVGHFSTHFFELMFPTLAVILARDTGLPLEEVLGWSFLGYLFFGLGALPAGFLTDRIGARKMLIIAMAGMGVSAMAAAEAQTGRALTFCLAVLGIFASIYHPAGMSLISRTIRARGRALGVNGIFGNLAIATTPVITATLCTRMGWQDAYQITGFAMCGVAVLSAFLPIDEPPNAIQPRPQIAPGANRQGARPLFFLLCVAAMLGGISYRGNTLVQPAYFAERVSSIGFGATTSLVYLFGIGGQYLGGFLADRRDLRWLYLAFHALSLPALLAMTVLSGLPLVVGGGMFVFFSLGMQPIENSLFAQVTPSRWRATGYGIKFVLTFGVGSLAVWLVEWVKAAAGLQLVLLCLAGVVALLVVVISLLVSLSAGRAIRNDVPRVGHWAVGATPSIVAGGQEPNG